MALSSKDLCIVQLLVTLVLTCSIPLKRGGWDFRKEVLQDFSGNFTCMFSHYVKRMPSDTVIFDHSCYSPEYV